MIDTYLSQHENKTLEFKANLTNPLKIVKTVVAFANTAGGTIVIGVEDKTKMVIGVDHVLAEEERISNIICDSIAPMIIPDIDIVNHEGKELLLIHVPCLPGPFYLKQAGVAQGVFVRLGSSDRVADSETLHTLQRLAKRISFDEMICASANIHDLDEKLIIEKLHGVFKQLSNKHYESLGIVRYQNKKQYATYAGILLFAQDRMKWLPDSIVKCVSFGSDSKKNIIDKREIKTNLIDAIDEVMIFLKRNSRVFSEIGEVKRVDIPEYPLQAVREAVINAFVHSDYSMAGTSIQISIYRNRMEIMSPGGLPFGQTLHSALSGVSKMRNPVIGRIFREIGIIETLGIGLQRIVQSYENSPAKAPEFEEVDHFFKVTLYARPMVRQNSNEWVNQLEEMLLRKQTVATNEMANIWNVSVRTARSRLLKLVETGYLKRNAKSKTDPHATYSKW